MSFNIEVEGGSSVRLPTAGKYCDRDIVITATGGGGNVGGISAYAKVYVTPDHKNGFVITNPLGGFAKKVSITCPVGSAVLTTNGMIQQYTMDTSVGIGAMYYIHATNGNLVCSGCTQMATATSGNARFAIEEGKITARSYGSSNGMWDTTCEYEIEIWQ